MARRLFFVPEVRRATAELQGELAQHLTRSLRVEAGQLYEISDNEQLYLAEVTVARKSLVEFRVKEKLEARPAPFPMTLFASLFKFDHFEVMIEKATELGVAAIQPVIAERTDYGLEKAAVKRAERWKRIAMEASQQCRRVRMPAILDLLPLSKVLAAADGLPVFLDERPGAPGLLDVLEKAAPQRVSFLLGPEGGWADREATAIVEAGWHAVSLGPLVLRAETAAIAALAQTSGFASRGSRS